MKFTLRQLTYFKALAEQRNFGRAAAVCNVSQPALSVQIRTLEEALGGPLVERRTRDVVLTPLGRTVLEMGAQVLNAAQHLDQLGRDGAAVGQSLSLGLIPTIAPYLLPGVLAALRAENLALQISVREAKTSRLVEALADGSLDAAVMALPSGSEELSETPLFEDRFLLAGSPARLQAAGAVRPTDLEPRQLMLLEDGHCLTDQALEVCGRGRGQPGINLGASSLATLSRMVAAGFGLTLMPELAARTEAQSVPDLALRRFPAPEPSRPIGLVRRRSSPAAPWFDRRARVLTEVGKAEIAAARRRAAA